ARLHPAGPGPGAGPRPARRPRQLRPRAARLPAHPGPADGQRAGRGRPSGGAHPDRSAGPARPGRHAAHRRDGGAFAPPAAAAACAANPVRPPHPRRRAEPGAAARGARRPRLAGRGADGHAPARRQRAHPRGRHRRPRRGGLCARAQVAAGAGRRGAKACGMNSGESEVVDYIDTLLDEAQASASAPTPATSAENAPSAEPVAVPATAADPEPVKVPDPIPDQAPAPAPTSTPTPPTAASRPPLRAPAPAPSAAPGASPAPVPLASAPRWLRELVDGASYGLELLRVQEVVRLVPIVPMRGARPAVLGVMNLRGRIVPVFDLGLWLGTGRVEPGDQSRIVVVERDDELIGVLVSAVEDVVTLGRDRIEPPLPGGAAGVILGVARVGSVPTVLFDAWALYA